MTFFNLFWFSPYGPKRESKLTLERGRITFCSVHKNTLWIVVLFSIYLLYAVLTVEARTSLWASIERWVLPTKIVTSMRCPCLLNSSISGKAPFGMSHWLKTTQSVPSLNSISEKGREKVSTHGRSISNIGDCKAWVTKNHQALNLSFKSELKFEKVKIISFK